MQKESKYAALINYTYRTSVIGFIALGTLPKDVSEAVERIGPIVKKAIIDRVPDNRFMAATEILGIIAPFVKEYIEEQTVRQRESDSNEESSESTSDSGVSLESDNSSNGTPSRESNNSLKLSEEMAKEIERQLKELAKSNNLKSDLSPDDETKQNISYSFSLTNTSRQNNRDASPMLGSEAGDTQEKRPSDGKNPSGNGETDGDANAEYGNNQSSELDKSMQEMANVVKQLQEKMVGRIAEKQLEEERLNEMRCANPFPYTIERKTSVTDADKEKYRRIAQKAIPVSRKLQKSILQLFKDKRNGSTQRGLVLGRRFEAKTVVNKSGKYFSKKCLPTEVPRLRVDVLVDQSDSTREGLNEPEIEAAIAVDDFCSSLQIKHRILGYSSDSCNGYSATIHSYVEPTSVTNNDKYRLSGIKPSGTTPTYTAIKYALKDIKKSPEEYRILLVITDGQSNDGGSDKIKEIAKEAKKQSIAIIAAGIGSDRASVEKEFGTDNFMNIDDPETMPKRFCKLIRRYLVL